MIPEEFTKIIVEAIGSIAILLVTTYVIPWIKGKIGEDKYNLIDSYTELTVRSAEQLYESDQWREKKLYVYECISEKLAEIGLELSDTEINNIIEGWVNAVKKGNK